MSPSRHSPGLRKRNLPPDAADAKGSPAPVTHTPQAASAGRYLIALVSLALSGAYFYSHWPTRSELPSDYILCSSDGDKIYTVDDMNPNVQCFVVKGEHFVDVGSVGEWGYLPSSDGFAQ